MKLTPLDIRKQEFDRSFRGFDPDEVRNFLEIVATQWEELVDERRRLESRVTELKNKIDHYEKVEEALQEALQTARDNAEEKIKNAEREAELIVEEAEAEAREITEEAKELRNRLKQETTRIDDRRSEIVARLRAFLMSEMELLARFEGDDPVGFIKLLPSEDRDKLRQAGVDLNQLESDVESYSEDASGESSAGSPPESTRDDDTPDADEAAFEDLWGASESEEKPADDAAAPAGPPADPPADPPSPAETSHRERVQPPPAPESAPSEEDDASPFDEDEWTPGISGSDAPASAHSSSAVQPDAETPEADAEDEDAPEGHWASHALFTASGEESDADTPESPPGEATTDESGPDQPPAGPGESAEKPDDNVSASQDEIDRIRRILDDID